MSVNLRLKHEWVAEALEREIRSGELAPGDRLPGELALARRFRVSRNTLRAALAQLAANRMIATRNGKGSYVSFDGRPDDTRLGWAWALPAEREATTVRLHQLALATDEELAQRFGLASPEVVVVERTWSLVSGEVVSYECSRIPAVGVLRDLPSRGLVEGSLTESLRQAGLRHAHGSQRIRARAIDRREAELLGRKPGEWFVEIRRISYDPQNTFVEQVDGLLDPTRCEVEVAFGGDE